MVHSVYYTQVNVYVHSVYKLCTGSTDSTYTREHVHAYTYISGLGSVLAYLQNIGSVLAV